MTVFPRYREVFDLVRTGRQSVLKDGRTGVVDDSGKPEDDHRPLPEIEFLKGELLAVTGNRMGVTAYIDLKTDRTYREKPVVFSYGGVELLRVGETFHSRTQKAYASMHGLHKDSLCFYGFYLKIPDYRVPKSCKLVDSCMVHGV